VRGNQLRFFAARLRRRWWGVRRRLRLLPRENLSYNRRLWDLYASNWDDPRFVRDQVDEPEALDPSSLQVVGDEWAQAEDVDRIVTEFIHPYLSPDTVAVEIGVGGGRIASRVAPRVARLVCFDVSARMLRRAKLSLSKHDNVEFLRLEEPRLPDEFEGRVDFIYSFDVFMHLDLHTMWRYVQEMSRMLRPGGRALVHVPNLAAPAGWKMFTEQDRYSIEDGWFLSPDMVRAMVEHTDLIPIKDSRPDPSNLYLNRDYLAVVEKPGA
jgi:SAM-dependent methyltransferase